MWENGKCVVGKGRYKYAGKKKKSFILFSSRTLQVPQGARLISMHLSGTNLVGWHAGDDH